MINITFSWDDGSIYDLKMVELMNRYDIKAMFFIPTINWERECINKKDILELFKNGMEIGAHTKSHKYLTTIPFKNVENEILDNKKYLEDIISKEVDIFCYPGGFYNKRIEKVVKRYFKRARSARTMRFNIQYSFTVDTSFHFYKRGVKSILKNCLINDKKEFFYIIKSIKSFDTFEIYKAILINLLKKDKNYNIHIWGHTWEIEEYKLWDKLEDFLKFIKNNNFNIKSNKEMYL